MKGFMMQLAAGLALVGSLILASGVAQAHGQSVGVQPATARPGDTVTVTGKDLGASRGVEVRLVGTGVDADLGDFQTDADGGFTGQVKLPPSLAAGSYQLRAVGAETAETDLSVTAAGAWANAPMAPAVRERSLIETAGLVALFGLVAGLGLFFARTAREGTTAGSAAR